MLLSDVLARGRFGIRSTNRYHTFHEQLWYIHMGFEYGMRYALGLGLEKPRPGLGVSFDTLLYYDQVRSLSCACDI